MIVLNKTLVKKWLAKLWENNYVYHRYPAFKVSDLTMNWRDELEKHARNYLNFKRDFTFHHIRLLFKELSSKPMVHPLVGIWDDNGIQVNPGGSRLIVAKKLGIKTVQLDLIHRKDQVIPYGDDYYIEIKNFKQMFKPYDDVDEKGQLGLAYTKHYHYEIFWTTQWHWTKNDMDKWLKAKGDIKCTNLLDYYFI